MSASAPVAVDHSPTRRGLRSLWLQAWVLTSAACAALVANVIWVVAAGPDLAPPTPWSFKDYVRAMSLPLLLAVASWLLVNLDRLVRIARISRALHRHPWRRLAGSYRDWDSSKPVVTIYGNATRHESVLSITTETGAPILLDIKEPGGQRPRWADELALRALEGGEAWLAMGEKGPGVAALAAGGTFFLTKRLRAGSRRERESLEKLSQPGRG